MIPRTTGTCVACNCRRHVSDLAVAQDAQGKHELCHGAWDESPTCYERFGVADQETGP